METGRTFTGSYRRVGRSGPVVKNRLSLVRGTGGRSTETSSKKAQTPFVKLYVDDVRVPPAGWVLARTVKEAIGLLEAGGVTEVSLDYFIGEGEGGTFLPVAHFIADMPKNRRPQRARLHTASGAGAARLAQALKGTVELTLL